MVVGVYADGKNALLRVLLDVPYGLAYARGAHRPYFHETETEIAQVVIQFAMDIETGAEADGVAERQAEHLARQDLAAVPAQEPRDAASERNPAEQFEIAQAYPGGLLEIHLPDKRSNYDTVQSHLTHTGNKSDAKIAKISHMSSS